MNKKRLDKFMEGEWIIVLLLFVALEISICGAIWTKVFEKWFL